MIFYSAFVMDSATRRILLFRKTAARLWQTAHTSYRPAPKDNAANDAGLQEAFGAYFQANGNLEENRVVTGHLFMLYITDTRNISTSFEYGDIMPWDIGEALKLNLDNRTRLAIKKNIGLLMFFSDVDRDVWCNIQDLAHAPSR